MSGLLAGLGVGFLAIGLSYTVGNAAWQASMSYMVALGLLLLAVLDRLFTDRG